MPNLADLRLGRWQDVLRDIPDGTVRLILTSPPYDDARTYEDQLEPVDFTALADFAIRVLVPGGTLAMILDGAVNDGHLSTTPFRVACEWEQREEWRLAQVLAYGRHGQPGEYRGRFRRDHEPLWVWHKHGPIVCNKDVVAERARNHADPHRYQWATERDGSKRTISTDREVRQIRHRGSFWDYGPIGFGHDKSAATGHPATFAEVFALDAVRVWSNPGEVVADPFTGSGTVARACVDLGRRFVGAELVEKYWREAQQRLAQGALAL
jgi:DNA modification methylase